MARKVLISVLGTGFYDACKYVKEGFISSETRFIQQATLEYLQVKDKWGTNSEGNSVDTIIILLTENAKKTNWDKDIVARKNPKTGCKEPYIGLEQVITNMQLSCRIQTLHIPDGKTEEEMWTIFNSIFEELMPADELYFDLTHSFRYLPMLVLILGNYAKFLKAVSVKQITYGNFEARDISSNEAPLMDILPLALLQDWTYAAVDLIKNGNIESFVELTENNAVVPLLRAKSKKNINRKKIEDRLGGYVDSLRNHLQDMKLCNAPNIINSTTINQIYDRYNNIGRIYDNVVAPIPPIIDRIQESLCGFEKTESDDFTSTRDSLINGYEAAIWCYEHQLFQQSITILEENITTHFCRILGTDEHNYDQRKATNAFLREGKYREEDWKDERLSNVRQRVLHSTDDADYFVYLMRDNAKWIHDKRNAYNHASMTYGKIFTPSDVDTLGDKLHSIRQQIVKNPNIMRFDNFR